MKYLKLLVFLLMFFLLLLGYLHPISSITQDLGRHLKTGEIIINTYSVPKTNLFSYTYPNFPFINHHWFSEVIYFTLFQKIGFNGLLALNTALALMSFGLIFFTANKKNTPIPLLLCPLLYIPILFERTDVRPEFFSFLFLSLFIVILYRFREKFTRLIFLLPFIELVWVNTHIYFPIGIAVIGLFFTDAIISRFKNPNTKIRISSLLFVLFASVLITLFNPNGLKGALYPLSVFQNYGYTIEENQNIFFLWNINSKQSILFFFIAAPILFTSLFLNFKRVPPIDWLVSAFFTILAIFSIRNFPLFAFATFIPFTRALSGLKLFTLSRQVKMIILVFLLFLFVFEAYQIYIKKGIGLGAEKGAKEGVDFFIANGLKGPIFNNFDIGSYLDYRLYPKEKVFVDGRPEAYPSQFFKNDYIPMQIDKNKFAALAQKYNFNTIFFSHTDQTPWAKEFMKQIVENKSWTLIYLDDYVVILTKNKNTKPKIQTDYSNIRSLIQLALFFQLVNFEDQEIKIYQKILALDPSSCPALYNLTLRLQEKDNPSASIFLTKFQDNCQ